MESRWNRADTLVSGCRLRHSPSDHKTV